MRSFRVSEEKHISSIKAYGADFWIQKLRLRPHPEGGYYRQSYRADLILDAGTLHRGFAGKRPAATAIYFLLERRNFSAFHRLRSDEMWHFYAGSALSLHIIDPGGHRSRILLGSDPVGGEAFQAVVRAGCWFAAELRDPQSWALVGCTVSPGFDFNDFELGKRNELLRQFPQHRKLIGRLTRE